MSNFEPPIMTIKGAKLSFGTNHLFTDVELYINRGDKICLVGRNGSGKSTLLKVIAGDIEADDGEIFIQPGTKISYMPQDTGQGSGRRTRYSAVGRADQPSGYADD